MSRAKREARNGVYDELANDHLPALIKFEDDLCQAEKFLEQQFEEDREALERAQKQRDQRFYLMLGLAIASVFFGVLSLLN